MKKWKEYMMLAVLCISMVGCGKKDSGSELLTEVQETVTPVEEVVKPEGEETPEGIRLHVYSGDESAENIVQHTVYVNEITENTVMRELTEALDSPFASSSWKMDGKYMPVSLCLIGLN